MYEDDLVIIEENENDLQRSLFYLTDILVDYIQLIFLFCVALKTQLFIKVGRYYSKVN